MPITWQGLAVMLLVAVCSVHAAWALMPSSARRWLAAAALRLPLPVRVRVRVTAPLRQAAKPANACGCHGCDATMPKPRADAVQPLSFHPRPRR